MPHAPLRVLVLALSARTGGGGTHVVNQVLALAALPETDVTIWATGSVADRLSQTSAGLRVVRHPPRGLLRRALTEQISGALAARSYDVVSMTGNFALAASPAPQVVTLQNAWYFGDEVRRFRRARCPRPMRVRLCVESIAARASIRRATRVCAVSETMRQAMIADLGSDRTVDVVRSAAPVLPPPTPGPIGHALRGRFVLVVAHDDPHKEWDKLIDAFEADSRLPPLVIVGRPRPHRTIRNDERVRMLGEITDRGVIADLYRNAACCLAHSRFESFGLSPVEALSSGAPVVASDIAAHRETCRGHASLYPPTDMTAMSEKVLEAAHSGAAPPARLALRTWQENAREFRALLAAAASASAPATE